VSTPAPARRPVLFVHGIWDKGDIFDDMVASLRARGFAHLEAIDLAPNDGSVTLPESARQLDQAARALLARSGAAQLDLVGFSMGSLVARWWLVKLGGRQLSRRFISISGPQSGTLTAHLNRKPGVTDMRPGSDFLKALESDEEGFGDVEVLSMWTPLDLMIVPARSGVLKDSEVQKFWVALHPLMPSDGKVIAAVGEALSR
jgi:triacylglycerol esterase/lipase EstA (alpha/beta hydrolase family)